MRHLYEKIKHFFINEKIFIRISELAPSQYLAVAAISANQDHQRGKNMTNHNQGSPGRPIISTDLRQILTAGRAGRQTPQISCQNRTNTAGRAATGKPAAYDAEHGDVRSRHRLAGSGLVGLGLVATESAIVRRVVPIDLVMGIIGGRHGNFFLHGVVARCRSARCRSGRYLSAPRFSGRYLSDCYAHLMV